MRRNLPIKPYLVTSTASSTAAEALYEMQPEVADRSGTRISVVIELENLISGRALACLSIVSNAVSLNNCNDGWAGKGGIG